MRPHTFISLLAAGSLAYAACGGSNDSAGEPVATTLAPESAPAAEPPATEPVPEPTDQTEPPMTEPPATDAPASEPPARFAVPPGAAALPSSLGFDETVASVTAVIENNDALTLVATIDHAANAANAGLDLAPTTELIFGNPRIGSPLMTSSPTVGIDLPQKMLVMQADDGSVQILWNSSAYLAMRHGLEGVDEQLATIDTALPGIAATAAGNADGVEPVVGSDAPPAAGLVTLDASGTAREAADRLIAAIDGNPNLILVANIDHAANAARVDLELPPIIEVIFGNPNLGTPLMQASSTIGMDLPQKMLFVETGDGTTITYNDPAYLAERHGIDPAMPEWATIGGALDTLSGAASGA